MSATHAASQGAPSGPRILLVEDEENLGSTLTERLQHEGFQTTWASTVEDALSRVAHCPFHLAFHLAILDVSLPDGSGFDLAVKLRGMAPSLAVIFLTAHGSAEDRVRGLEIGAEDYVVKPFHLRELLLRVRNVLKRVEIVAPALFSESNSGVPGPLSDFATPEPVTVGRARVHFSSFRAWTSSPAGDVAHSLTLKECALLKLLHARKGRALSRDEILNQVWREGEYPTPRTVDNFILRLRKIVERDPDAPEVITSVRGVGYQLL